MKRAIATVLVCLFCCAGCITGCATLDADVAKVEADIKAVDWSAKAKWFDGAVKGLQGALGVVTVIDPALAAPMSAASILVGAAQVGADTLMADAQKYKDGTLTAADVSATASTVNAQYKIAANAVAKVVKPAAALNAIPGPVPTTAPAGK